MPNLCEICGKKEGLIRCKNCGKMVCRNCSKNGLCVFCERSQHELVIPDSAKPTTVDESMKKV